jgi:hypothetical protein
MCHVSKLFLEDLYKKGGRTSHRGVADATGVGVGIALARIIA